jgi:hypothetical protein
MKEERSGLKLNASPFIPNEKFLVNKPLTQGSSTSTNGSPLISDKINDINKVVPYYPLPSNEGYEKFLQTMKKDQCKT